MSELSERIYGEFSASGNGFPEADRLKDRLEAYRPFSGDEAIGLASYAEAFLVRFVHSSNAIEGSTLTEGDTALVLEGEFLPDKPGRDIFAARGSADGFAYCQKALSEGKGLDVPLIQDIHERVALDCQPATRGVLRKSPVYLRGSDVVPANWEEVRPLLRDLVAAEKGSKLHPVENAAAFHAMFEKIHPFSDGNGRTGRLLMNFMLERDGYPPIAIKHDGKGRYIDALRGWQSAGLRGPLVDLVESCVKSELDARIGCVESTRFPRTEEGKAAQLEA